MVGLRGGGTAALLIGIIYSLNPFTLDGGKMEKLDDFFLSPSITRGGTHATTDSALQNWLDRGKELCIATAWLDAGEAIAVISLYTEDVN